MSDTDKKLVENFISHPVMRIVQMILTIVLAILAFSLQRNLSNIDNSIDSNTDKIENLESEQKILQKESNFNTNDILHLEKADEKQEISIKEINAKLDKILEKINEK